MQGADNAADKLGQVRDMARELAVRVGMMGGTDAGMAAMGANACRRSVAAMWELRQCHGQRVALLARRLQAAQEAIDAVPDSRARSILTMYYIQGLGVESIAEVLDLDPRHVRRLRKQAIGMVDL